MALYDTIGRTYARFRRPDPRIARAIEDALADTAFDAALAVLTVHLWPDAAAGLAEMQRVAKKQVVLTWDQIVADRFWIREEYVPIINEREASLAALDAVCAALDVSAIVPVPVPWDCTDGFFGAYWRRPQMYLDPDARAAISALALLDAGYVDRALTQLARDLQDGTWHARHANLLTLDELDLGYRLVIAGG